MFWQELTLEMADHDYIKMKQYEDMPLTEYLNLVSFHLYLKRKKNKVLSDAASKKGTEPAKMAILGYLFDRF